MTSSEQPKLKWSQKCVEYIGHSFRVIPDTESAIKVCLIIRKCNSNKGMMHKLYQGIICK